MTLERFTTADGIVYRTLSCQGTGPAPTLLLLASGGEETLTSEPYCRVGRLLHGRGWNVVSLDLPCHGEDRRLGEPDGLAGWAARIGAGEDIVKTFRRSAFSVLDDLKQRRIADPNRIAAAGTSRGGFMALHAAAHTPMIREVAALAPVTDLMTLREFEGMDRVPLVRALALRRFTHALSMRAAWIIIGSTDDRVGTDRAVSFARSLARRAVRRHLKPSVTLLVVPVEGHTSLPVWHYLAANWLSNDVSP